MRRLSRSTLSVGFALAVATLASCATLEYRKVQDNFNAAVSADNVQSLDSLGALTSTDSEQRYAQIQAQLTDEYIQNLDARLQPNAYAIRAVSQWRCGMLKEARDSALAGQNRTNIASSPRDQMVLKMVPALVIDEQLVSKYKLAHESLTEADYTSTYPADFVTALKVLQGALDTAPAGTPESVKYYVHLQRFRVLVNWWIVISGIERSAPNGGDARERARADAQQRLGMTLEAAMRAERDAVPQGQPLRNAIDAIKTV